MGDRTERQLAKLFNTESWWSQRAAASGSATAADLPDVTLAHDGIAFAAEEKTTSQGAIYVDEREVAALEAYANAYGMTPMIIGRFKQTSPCIAGTNRNPRAYYLWHPMEMERTESGRYRGSPDDGAWSLRIAAGESPADGLAPRELTGRMLRYALVSDMSGVSDVGWRNPVVQEDDNNE